MSEVKRWVETLYGMEACKPLYDEQEVFVLASDHDAEVARLREALRNAKSDLTCSENGTHYCPKCDRSLFNAHADICAALAAGGKT